VGDAGRGTTGGNGTGRRRRRVACLPSLVSRYRPVLGVRLLFIFIFLFSPGLGFPAGPAGSSVSAVEPLRARRAGFLGAMGCQSRLCVPSCGCFLFSRIAKTVCAACLQTGCFHFHFHLLFLFLSGPDLGLSFSGGHPIATAGDCF